MIFKIIFFINLIFAITLNAKLDDWMAEYIDEYAYNTKKNENKYIEEGKFIKVKVIEQCHVKWNEYFSNNLFSPIIDEQFDLLLDTRDVVYPEKISFIDFEPFGWRHYHHRSDNYSNDESNIFSINDDNIIHFNSLSSGGYSIKNLNSNRIKQIVKSDLKLKIDGYNTFITYDGSLKEEEKKCNTKISEQLNEKMIKDIISTIIFILLFLGVIFILKKLKDKIFNKRF